MSGCAWWGHIHGITVAVGRSRAEVAAKALRRGVGSLDIVPIHPALLESVELDESRTEGMTERDILWQVAEKAMGGTDVYLEDLEEAEAAALVDACFERIDAIERREGRSPEPAVELSHPPPSRCGSAR